MEKLLSSEITDNISAMQSAIERIPNYHIYGKVTAVGGLVIEASGLEHIANVGSRCKVFFRASSKYSLCEVIGFKQNLTILMPFSSVEGIGIGCVVELIGSDPCIHPHKSWLGHVLNAFGEPVEGLEHNFITGNIAVPIRNKPPSARTRNRIGQKLDLGIRSLNSFASCCEGQRMGIFSGSGVGKSILLSMLSRYSSADINVIGLIGERGREVKEFIEDDLGEEGLAKSVVVVATSDESALMRRQAAWLTMSIAEYFRDQGKKVLCLMDSITRFAMAQREIGLAIGEPPTTKGYTPTVFSELPKLLERAGPADNRISNGSITGLFSVLVDGDDHNEPIADASRGILDGHIVLNRKIAQRGRFPALDVLQSVSRSMPNCNSDSENQLINSAREYISIYEDMADMIRLGAYRSGSDPKVDEAIILYPQIENFLKQEKNEKASLAEGYQKLQEILMK